MTDQNPDLYALRLMHQQFRALHSFALTSPTPTHSRPIITAMLDILDAEFSAMKMDSAAGMSDPDLRALYHALGLEMREVWASMNRYARSQYVRTGVLPMTIDKLWGVFYARLNVAFKHIETTLGITA